jgi:hypothetical protein
MERCRLTDHGPGRSRPDPTQRGLCCRRGRGIAMQIGDLQRMLQLALGRRGLSRLQVDQSEIEQRDLIVGLQRRFVSLAQGGGLTTRLR